MREKADSNVQAVLDVKVVREFELKYDSVKHSIRAEAVYQQAKNNFPDLGGKKLVDAARKIVGSDHEKTTLDFLARKFVQGKFSDIIELQRQDPFFHSVMYDLPQDQLSWLMRTCVDCLPTHTNCGDGIRCFLTSVHLPLSLPFSLSVSLSLSLFLSLSLSLSFSLLLSKQGVMRLSKLQVIWRCSHPKLGGGSREE